MNIEQVVREVNIRGTVQGMDRVEAAYRGVADAADRTATVTEKVTKAQLSAEAAVEKLRLRYAEGYRQQQQLADAEKVYQRAVEQGVVSKTAAAAELANIQNKLGQATSAQKAMSAASSELNARAQSMAGSLGGAGQVLGSLGPAGLGTAAVIAGLAIAFKSAADAALALAERAGKLKDFSETTGFTVVQLQALEKAGEQVGVSSESVTRGLERFSVAMDDVKKGTGPVFESILEINPALAQQMKQVGSLTEAWDIFAKAIKQSDLEQANKLARSVFGRSGVEITRLARANADAGGIAGVTAQLKEVDRITAAQAERWDTLGDQISSNMKLAKQNVAAVFTEPVLNAMLAFSEGFVKLSHVAKSFTVSDEMKLMFKLISAAASTAGAVGSGVSIVTGWFGKSSPQASSGGAPFETRWGDLSSDANAIGIDKARADKQKNDLAALIAAQERYNAVAGAAVTPAQNLKLALDKISLAAKENKISAEQAAAATGVLKAQFASSQFSAYLGALGQAVTVEEQVKAKQNQLNDAMRQGATYTLDQIDNQIRLTEENALGITQIKSAADAERVRADALLIGREAAIAYEIVQSKVNEARRNGVDITPTYLAQLQREAEAYAKIKVETDRYEEAIKFAKDSAEQFAKTLVQGLLSGKSVMESLSAAAKQLASSLADSAIKSLFSGDFVGAAVKGVAAITAAVIGNETEQDKSLEEAGKRFAAMTDQVIAFNRAADKFNIGPLTSELEELRRVHDTLALAALEARDYAALNQIHETLNRGIRRVFGEWMDGVPVLGELSQKIQDLRNEAQGLKDVIPEAAAAIDQGLIARIRQVTEEAERGLMADINSAKGLDWLNEAGTAIARFNDLAGKVDPTLLNTWFVVNAQKIIDSSQLTGDAFQTLVTQLEQAVPGISESLHEFTEAIKRTAEEIAAARQSFADQLFILQQDQSTLAGQLAVFDLQAQRAREAEIRAGGEAIVQLEALQAAQRAKIIQDFADRSAQAERQRAEQAARALADATSFLTGAFRSIQDYINHFNASPASLLTPQAQLSNAQGAFASQLGIINTGTAEQRRAALSSITQYADDAINAIKAVYGSTATGGAMIQDILAQLAALPATQRPEDYIVAAIEEASTANVTSLDAIEQAILQSLIAAVNTGDATAVANALVPHFQYLTGNVAGGLLTQAQFENKLNLPTGSLTKLFNEIDANGDGFIEKAEAIKLATQGTKIGTDNLDEVRTNTDTLPVQATRIAGMETSLLALAQVSSNTQSAANILASIANITQASRLMMQQQNSAWGVQSLTPLPGFMTGGYTGPGPANQPAGIVHAGEYVLDRFATSAITPEVLDAINDNRALPFVPVSTGGESGGTAAEVRELREEVRQLRSMLERLLRAGNEINARGHGQTTAELNRANRIAQEQASELRRAS